MIGASQITHMGYAGFIRALEMKLHFSNMADLYDCSMELTKNSLLNFTKLRELQIFFEGDNLVSISGILSLGEVFPVLQKLKSYHFIF